MRIIAATALLVATLITAGAVSVPQDPGFKTPQPEPRHQFHKQLVGEWDVKYEASMGPDAEPMEATGTDTVRAVGDYFVLVEITTTMMGMEFTGVMKLGYIEDKGKYVGTWIDSMTSHLWLYEGTLNEAGDTLTLRTEGPSMLDPTATAKYKEVITIKDKDHRTFTSNIQLESGEWMAMMTAEYTRKK